MIDYPSERDMKLFRSQFLRMSSLFMSFFNTSCAVIITYVICYHFYSINMFPIRQKRL